MPKSRIAPKFSFISFSFEAHVALIACILSASVFVRPLPAQQSATPHPVSVTLAPRPQPAAQRAQVQTTLAKPNTAGTTALSRLPIAGSATVGLVPPAGEHLPAASLPHMYAYAFRSQLAIGQLALRLEKDGKSGAGIASYLSKQFGMSEADFGSFVTSAGAYKDEAQKARAELKTHTKEIRDAQARHATPELKRLLEPFLRRSDDVATEQMNTLHAQLSAEASAKLDTAVTKFYSSAVVTKPTVDPQSNSAAALEPMDGEGGSQCNCGAPDVLWQGLYFTSDGGTVYAIVEAMVEEIDFENGCELSMDTVLLDNGEVADEDPWGSSYYNITIGYVETSVNVGDNYNYSSFLTESCDSGQSTYLYVSGISFTTGPPQINGTNLGSIATGTSGQLTLTGLDLGGPPGNTPTVNVTANGVSMSASGPASYSPSSPGEQSTQGLNYQADSSATIGSFTYSISTVWGDSNTETVNVTCGAATITGIQPQPFVAGQTYDNVIITGTGFCQSTAQNPAVAMTVPNGTIDITNPASNSSTSITATVTVGAQDPTEQGTFYLYNTYGSGGGGVTNTFPIQVTAQPTSQQIFFVNPYKFASSSSPTVDPNSVASSLPTNQNAANGIVGDGVATVIVAYQTQNNQSVTFSSNNFGLLNWDPNFLNPSPNQGLPSGTTTATVNPGDPGWVSVNGSYYALALVRAPLATSAGMLTTYSVWANQNGSQTSQQLQVYPKPVIFVHGLWSDQHAFDGFSPLLVTALEGQTPEYSSWMFDSDLCYSIYLRFDAASDPQDVPYTCEVTSTEALAEQISIMFNVMQEYGVVGGRFDLVVHSMGGLATRNFANPSNTKSNYFNYTNLNQGTLGTVVTLDTPEAGSAVADYLIAHKDDTLTAPPCIYDSSGTCVLPNVPWTIWQLAGCSSSDTLQTCFGKINHPLSFPGADASTGAPYSLETAAGLILNGQQNSILNAPAPNSLPNATWRAISAYYPPPYTGVRENVLHFLVDELIAMTEWGSNPMQSQAPTVDDIFGGANNDVVVLQQSQVAGSPNSSVAVPFYQLAHSGAGLPSWGAYLLAGRSNANVLNQQQVANMAACLLLSAGTGSCQDPSGATPAVAMSIGAPDASADTVTGSQADVSASASLLQSNAHLDDTMVTITQPVANFTLAEPNELAITVHNSALTNLRGDQIVEMNGNENAPFFVPNGDGEFPILHHADGSAYIFVTPLRLGKLRLDLNGMTPDGSIWHSKVRIQVRPSTRKPDDLLLTHQGASGNTLGILPLSINGAIDHHVLIPQAKFNGIKGIVDLDASAVNFKLRHNGADVISLNPATGEVQPLHVGHAIIEMTYQGASNLTCVVVSLDPLTSPDSTCEDLLQPGEMLSLPPRLKFSK